MFLTIIFTLLIIGVILYAIDRFVPMDARIKQILYVVVLIVVLLWLFTALTGRSLPGFN